jgi:antitoxin HigA-1
LILTGRRVHLEALENDSERVDEIHLTIATRTKRARTIGLGGLPCPAPDVGGDAPAALKGVRLSAHARYRESDSKTVKAEYRTPGAFGWQALRRSCGTYLTNAPGICGAASVYRSAKQLGHSVQLAERHYLDVARYSILDYHRIRALAAALHVPTNRITGILNATRALTPETALRLERYFAGTTAQFWLNLQTSFDLRRAEICGAKALREIRPLKAELNAPTSPGSDRGHPGQGERPRRKIPMRSG